ncbi:MAG: 3-hydroxyisobutyrate dehydrogenase-like beta-hydroxyacid dehydrogenase [Gammaproteobacteria bacterium]|jgi:3-hydroxyisobutyrate dehydrogenase-like beta-hydroxyacid dehydrogenase
MKIGFIGLGTMGASFASNLQKAGYSLVVHDVSRQVAERHLQAGAEWADTPKALAQQSDVIMTSLPGPPEIEAVALDAQTGLIAGVRKGAVLFDLSTNSPTLIRHIHARFAEQGAHVLDAPVSGGPKGAASGKLAIWVGGDEAVFNEHRASLDAMGDQVRYIGPIGAGAIAKLVHNSAGYAVQAAVAEVFTAGVKAGVDPLALWGAIRQGARGRVRTFDSMADHFLINEYDPPDFALKLAHKDISLACELGRDVGVPMRMVNLAQQEMREALNRGWGHRDSRAYLLLQQERAGLLIDESREDVAAVLAADPANQTKKTG